MEFRGNETYRTTKILSESLRWTAYEAVTQSGDVVELRSLHLPMDSLEGADTFGRRLQLLSFCQHNGLRKILETEPGGEWPFVVVEAIEPGDSPKKLEHCQSNGYT